MDLPNLTAEDVAVLLPDASDIGKPQKGGQKIIFPSTIGGKRYVVKFMLTNPSLTATSEENQTFDFSDEVIARAKREVETLQQCNTPYLVKLGPILLTSTEYKGQSLIYFTEEFIEGKNLKEILSKQKFLSIQDLVRLGHDITEAIGTLWKSKKIHRDITPANIMRCDSTGDFVLLDAGVAFDITDESLTAPGETPGTRIYFCPEQMNPAQKRQLDFRCDLFKLGIVMYQAATGVHPFKTSATLTINEVFLNIQLQNPSPPSKNRKDLPEALNNTILRLLAKRPHLRYKTCEQLNSVFETIEKDL